MRTAVIWLCVLVFAGTVSAQKGLTAKQAARIRNDLVEKHHDQILRDRDAEMERRSIELDKLTMPFWFKVFGEKPKTGRSLYISLHGGGGAPAAVNDQQWHNQQRLYEPAEGIYLVPRAPTNTWNLWHQHHIDSFFSRLIENLIVFEGVDPNRVYVLGYSAGGDGVYQIGPRMADRWAAASMMAGHPNDARPDSLRNTPFSIQVGALDSAYKRNLVAAEWGKTLDQLQKQDPQGYVHFTKIYAGKGHWMDREDRVAISWMAKHTRDPYPEKVVWLQDAETHKRFYWLAVRGDSVQGRSRIVAERKGQTITIQLASVPEVMVLLNDEMLDLDRKVTVMYQGDVVYSGRPPRSESVIRRTFSERGDPASVYSAEITIPIPQSR